MQSNQREKILKIAVAAVAGLWALDFMIITPATRHWKDQATEIATLRGKVQSGHQLIEREQSIRAHWKEMLDKQLPADRPASEGEVQGAIVKWAAESRISFSSLVPTWRSHREGFDTYDCQATASGNQAAIGKFIYALEVDPLPGRLEDFELSTRDAKGQQLNLTMKFSFVRFTSVAKGSR